MLSAYVNAGGKIHGVNKRIHAESKIAVTGVLFGA
jgi:hypothetical protein